MTFLTEWRPDTPPTVAGAALLRANALDLPIDDATVDLIVTSPPYFALRDYRDGDGSLEGQVGAEATPQEFLESLWAATREMIRVLKPSGSIWVNLGDKYAGSGGHNNSGINTSKYNKGAGGWDETRDAPKSYNKNAAVGATTLRPKSLMGLPWRYAIGCIDDLGLILRSEVVWSKPNGLPESVTDRVRRSHEQWFHFTKEPKYYSAIDDVREPYAEPQRPGVLTWEQRKGRDDAAAKYSDQNGHGGTAGMAQNALGKLPGSVWVIATDPLKVPEHLNTDHFAAFPQEWPRRIILGWSPQGVCTACGEGRRLVTEVNRDQTTPRSAESAMSGANGQSAAGGFRGDVTRTVVGEKCACETPTAPTTPGVVLDPFGGTGTVAMVARALGRFGVSVDLSMDYLRLAQWRIFESGHAQKSIKRTADARGELW